MDDKMDNKSNKENQGTQEQQSACRSANNHQHTQQIRQHFCCCRTWMRLLYMLILTLFYTIAETMLAAIIVFQFFCMLFTGKINARLARLGEQASCYIYAILRYLNYNSEERPFPFSDWPSTPPTINNQSSDSATSNN